MGPPKGPPVGPPMGPRVLEAHGSLRPMPLGPPWGPMPLGPPGPPMGSPHGAPCIKILIFCYTFYVNIELYSTFAGHIWASYSSYEDDIDTNRILIQKTTILTVRNPPFELSGIGL